MAERAGRRVRAVDEHERKAIEAHARDATPVQTALGLGDLPGAEELRAQLRQLREARVGADEARQRLAAWEASSDVQRTVGARPALEAELHEAEARLAATEGALTRDVELVEQELERAGGAARPAPAVADEPSPVAVPQLARLLAASVHELGGDAAATLQGLAARAGAHAATLSGGQVGLSFDGGAPRIVTRGAAAAEVDAPLVARDLCWIALKLAILERALLGGGFGIVDDAFASLPEGGRRAVAGVLRQAARGGQLLHATADAAFRAAADHVAA